MTGYVFGEMVIWSHFRTMSLYNFSVMNRGIPPAMTELISVHNRSCVVFASFSECHSVCVWSLYNTVWLMDSESGGPLADSV